jgi:hypothetical protein
MDGSSVTLEVHGPPAGGPASKEGHEVQDTRYSLGPLWAEIRAELRDMRAARAARKALRRDLAYAAPRDFVELEAILERYPESQTADVRGVINERRTELQLASVPFPGR